MSSYILPNKIDSLDLTRLSLDSSVQKILVAETWNVSPHLETGLEVALRLAARGFQVDYLHYGYLLPYVEFYNSRGLGARNQILSRLFGPEVRGRRLLKRLASHYHLDLKILNPSKFGDEHQSIKIPDHFLNSIESLKEFSWNNSNRIGLSISSALASVTRNSQAIPYEYTLLCENMAGSFLRSFSLAQDLIEKYNYDALVVFNGRFPSVKGSVAAASQKKVPVIYHERGSSMHRFSLRNCQPHDRILLQRDIVTSWQTCNENLHAFKIAQSFFDNKRKGIEVGWKSFTKDHKPNQGFDLIDYAKSKTCSKKLIVYFSSSDDELVAADDAFQRSIFEWHNQKQALQALVDVVRQLDYALIVRVHPHLKSKSNADRDSWDKLSFLDCSTDISIVKSDSCISTYELLDAADAVVTYGSTVGIESVYWGKPSILMNDSFYDKISASCYKSQTRSELFDSLSAVDNLSVDPNSALPYGYYAATYGTNYQFYKPKDLFSGKFVGIDLSKSPFRNK